MADGVKHLPSGGIVSDLRSLLSVLRTRKTKVFAYGFVSAFVACTVFIAFSPSGSASPWFNNVFASASASTAPYRSQVSSIFSYIFPNSSSSPSGEGRRFNSEPLYRNDTTTSQSPPPGGTKVPPSSPKNQEGMGVGSRQNGVLGKNQTNGAVGSHQNGILGKIQAKGGDGSQQNGVLAKHQTKGGVGSQQNGILGKNHTKEGVGSQQKGASAKNQTKQGVGSQQNGASAKNQTKQGVGSQQNGSSAKSQTKQGVGPQKNNSASVKNQTTEGAAPAGKSGAPVKDQTKSVAGPVKNGSLVKNQTKEGIVAPAVPAAVEMKNATSLGNGHKGLVDGTRDSNFSASLRKGNGSSVVGVAPISGDRKKENWSIKSMMGCDIFQGRWVRDDSYPLYKEGSCPHIDEPFDCFLNGRPDRAYQKLRWQPSGCNIPRLNATDMLERLRGMRLVFVGDSLNRNMWESLVCILRNSIDDKRMVFEASGRHEFRTEGSYSFFFKDYNCTVEFFRSPFLVQEWEMPDTDGKKKETLRLDTIERSSSNYKDANIIVFNTGHWWTHEKTSKGKDYYQEGNRVYGELKVIEAFHKALNTWAKWVDMNINPRKSLVFFRGYSASHFRGGQWNSGGQCDRETEPIKNETYLSSYPPKMNVLESVIKGMKTPIAYLNITRITDYRKDAHPSIYRKQNLTEEERRSPDRYQDCSHWCLPGVPDSWNELLYAQLLIKQHQTP